MKDVPKVQGIYVLWLSGEVPLCLKVGLAGPRNGRGLAGRIQLHLSSNSANTVLARHMAADVTLPTGGGYDFRDRQQRSRLLAEKCHFQVLGMPDLTLAQLRCFERFLEAKLQPKYRGRVNRS